MEQWVTDRLQRRPRLLRVGGTLECEQCLRSVSGAQVGVGPRSFAHRSRLRLATDVAYAVHGGRGVPGPGEHEQRNRMHRRHPANQVPGRTRSPAVEVHQGAECQRRQVGRVALECPSALDGGAVGLASQEVRVRDPCRDERGRGIFVAGSAKLRERIREAAAKQQVAAVLHPCLDVAPIAADRLLEFTLRVVPLVGQLVNEAERDVRLRKRGIEQQCTARTARCLIGDRRPRCHFEVGGQRE